MLIRNELLEYVSIGESFGGAVVHSELYQRKTFYEDEDYLLDEINKLTLGVE